MRVLFVDDEPQVLSGLRRMLHGQRGQWQMQFAESGQQALDLMAEEPVDIVVSDMRMPGMDGAELLSEVQRRHPGTVRIILSGSADPDSALRAAVPAHQYLSKPCDTEELKATITRVFFLRDVLNHEKLATLVSQVTTLPSSPQILARLIDELQSDNASILAIAELISQDVGMSGKIMQMVNSSFFGTPRRVEGAAHAVALLGLEVLRPLVIESGIFTEFALIDVQGFIPEMLTEHSVFVSKLAKEIAFEQTGDSKFAEDAALAGMVHDIGRFLLAVHMPDEYGQVLALAEKDGLSLYDAELECLGETHASVGAYLMGLWGLPVSLMDAVAHHHQPSNSSDTEFTVLTAVHVANAIANRYSTQSDDASEFPADLDMEYLNRIDVADDKVRKWQLLAAELLTTTNR